MYLPHSRDERKQNLVGYDYKVNNLENSTQERIDSLRQELEKMNEIDREYARKKKEIRSQCLSKNHPFKYDDKQNNLHKKVSFLEQKIEKMKDKEKPSMQNLKVGIRYSSIEKPVMKFGLRNFGNTCYAGALLICLYHTEEFRNMIDKSVRFIKQPLLKRENIIIKFKRLFDYIDHKDKEGIEQATKSLFYEISLDDHDVLSIFLYLMY